MGTSSAPVSESEPPVATVSTPLSNLTPTSEIWVAIYGSDTNAGTLFKPMRTISAAVSAAKPGTAIMVKAGTYNDYIYFPGTGGLPNKAIFIRSADGRGAATITPLFSDRAAVRLLAASYVIVEGFNISGGVEIRDNPSVSGSYSSNVLFQNNSIDGGSRTGMLVNSGKSIYALANRITSQTIPLSVSNCSSCVMNGNQF